MKPTKTFLEWCRLQLKRHDAVGDFARDWVMDTDRPRSPSRSGLVQYLSGQNAIEAAVVAALKAYKEWLAS